ncbi:MAG: isopenicillin N synthase family oxygenase [Acidobacteria bacterium]|nr:isopenicillin N synthase family oxygenase [Acidobacteriota bacterium]
MADRKDDVSATNRDFIDYDQVRKDQKYRLAEASGAEAFDDDFRVRTCDIGRFLDGGAADRRAFARELGEALREIGFAILEGHGVDPAIHDEAFARVEEVFTRASLDTKMRFAARRHGSVNQGYFPIKETSGIHPDLVEGWVFCRRAFDIPDGRSDPPRLEEFWPDLSDERFFREMALQQERLIVPVMQSLLLHLGADEHLYDARLTNTNFALRLNYYPPVSEADDLSGAARLLGHEDVTMFTFLPAPRLEGLQVLNRKNMKWVRLDAPPGSIILNTGDYMQRISNDILPSTTHRVSKPRDPDQRKLARVSFPMNVYLWEEEILEVLPSLPSPRYAPVRAIEFHTATTSKYYGDDYAVKGE